MTLPRLARLQALLGQSRQCLARCESREGLLDQICRLAVHTGGMRLAWIGLVEGGTQGFLPVASCGEDGGLMAGFRISLGPEDPVVAALRNDRPFWSGDIPNDPAAPAWRQAALRGGWVSAAILPLHQDGKAIGALGLHAPEPEAFEEASRKAVLQLAEEISRGLQNFVLEARTRSRREDRDRLFQLSLDLLCVVGFDGHFTQLNPAWSRTLGWSLEELLATSWMTFVHPEDLEATRQALGKLRRGEPLLRFLHRFRRREGSYVWLSWNAFPVPEEGLVFAVVRDITERIGAERGLREQHAELELLYATTPVGLALMDRDFRFLRINERLASISGKPVAAHLGRTITEALPELADLFMPIYRRVLDTGEAVLDVEIHGETPGEPGVPRDWLASYFPVRDAEGAVTGISIAVTEITAQKRAEEARRLSHELFSKAFHGSPAGILITRIKDGTILDANEPFLRMFEYSREEVIGRTSLELNMLKPEARAQLVARRLEPGGLRNVELLSMAKSGRPLHLLLSSEPTDLDGEDCQITTLIDITERKKAEEALKLAHDRLRTLSGRLLEIQEAERRQLARELHDELGQVLTATKLNLQALEKYSDPSRLRESIAALDRALDQVRALSLELRPPLLDDLGLGAALRWLFDQLAQRSGLRVDLEEGLLDTRFPGALETAAFRVAQEALSNIVRHASATHVGLALKVVDGALHLWVRDDGAGFDAEAARARATSGGSLGLLSMEERAKLAGGGIVWTTAPGEGTEVHAWFSLDPPAP